MKKKSQDTKHGDAPRFLPVVKDSHLRLPNVHFVSGRKAVRRATHTYGSYVFLDMPSIRTSLLFEQNTSLSEEV